MDVLIQERIEGVGLNVAWPYLTQDQKSSFKQQARQIVHALFTLTGPPGYLFPDSSGHTPHERGVTQQELGILFPAGVSDEDLLGFAHNDLQPSNIIVKDDKIVGIIDWEMAGFFGERAGEVHRTMRGPSRESVQHLGLSEEKILDVTFWNDLYEEEG